MGVTRMDLNEQLRLLQSLTPSEPISKGPYESKERHVSEMSLFTEALLERADELRREIESAIEAWAAQLNMPPREWYRHFDVEVRFEGQPQLVTEPATYRLHPKVRREAETHHVLRHDFGWMFPQ